MIGKSKVNPDKNKVSVSVIIPSLGRINHLSRCIGSLLTQSVLPKEIIVVDNSTHKIENLELKYYVNSLNDRNKYTAIRYLYEKRPGSGNARNKGIKTARYERLVFIDEDCIPHKDWLKKILIAAKRHKEGIIQGKNLNGIPDNIFSSLVHFTTESYFQSAHFVPNPKTVESNLLDTKNFAMAKSLFKNYIYFDTRFIHFEDIDFSLRVRQQGIKIIYVPDVVVWHCGRGDLLSFIKREFVKGRNYRRFQKKWQEDVLGYNQVQKVLDDIHGEKIRKAEKLLKKEILGEKSIVFKILFWIFLYLDRLAILCGILCEEAVSDNIFTRIFLPRNTLIKNRRSQ